MDRDTVKMIQPLNDDGTKEWFLDNIHNRRAIP